MSATLSLIPSDRNCVRVLNASLNIMRMQLLAVGAARYHRSMPDPRFHYRLGLNQPVHSPTARRLAERGEAIGHDTDGEFRLEVFPESQLGPDPQMFADLRAGRLEFFLAGATLGCVAPSSALP